MGYRQLATRPVLTWAAVAVASRTPAIMGPLALVFLVRERPGGYGLGAALGAAFVVGEVIAAPWLGVRLRPERARAHLAGGLVCGAAGFAGLGLLHGAHPAVLVALALLAGGGPAAVPGGMRTLLTELVPPGAVARALSAESVLTFVTAAAAPALAGTLALGVTPYAPQLLAAAMSAAGAAGLWALPAGWAGDGTERDGAALARVLVRAWPAYVMGAAGMSLLALTELVLPALLEQRGIGVGWSGPLLAGHAVAAAVGAYLYGTRGWPGRLGAQALVLVLGVGACVVLVAVLPWLAGIAVALLLAGLLEAGVNITRSLRLREVLPAGALVAGYSVMYAAIGVGYAACAGVSGAVLTVATPATAVLGGVVLTLVLVVVSAVGDARTARWPAAGESAGGAVHARVDGTEDAGSAVGGGAGAGPGVGPEGAPVHGGGDAECRL